MELSDMKDVDGEPWDVAREAGRQVAASIKVAEKALETFEWAARGAWMSQEDYRTGTMPLGTDFGKSPLGRYVESIARDLYTATNRVNSAVLAAGHDPRSY